VAEGPAQPLPRGCRLRAAGRDRMAPGR